MSRPTQKSWEWEFGLLQFTTLWYLLQSIHIKALTVEDRTMRVGRNHKIVYLKRSIHSLQLEEWRLSALIFGSPLDVSDLQGRLDDVRKQLQELGGRLNKSQQEQ